MAGETLVEKCRVIDNTQATDKFNPTEEQISQFRLLFEEWQRKNDVVKDVYEGRTSFDVEAGKLWSPNSDDKRRVMIYKCIPELKEVFDWSKTTETIGYYTGLALAGGLMVPAMLNSSTSRRSFLRRGAYLVGSVLTGCIAGSELARYLQTNKTAVTCLQNTKYLDSVVDSVRKK